MTNKTKSPAQRCSADGAENKVCLEAHEADHTTKPVRSALPPRHKIPQINAFDAGMAAAVAWFATQGRTLATYRDVERDSHLTKHLDKRSIAPSEAADLIDYFNEGFGRGLAAAIAGVAVVSPKSSEVNHG